MPAKRKASEVQPAIPSTTRSLKKPKTAVSNPVRFVWKEREWVEKTKLYENIRILKNKDTPSLLIVKKVLRHAEYSTGQVKHFEIRALEALPMCNRIVGMMGYAHNYPDSEHGTAFFEYYPLGDLYHWKGANFDKKNFKEIPETYIWRFFIQMAQAVAFIHNRLGISQDWRDVIFHRDIKPKNVLVVDNGTTYPSFKLHDFGCGTVDFPGKARNSSYCGTFEWQAPENPKINTAAAEIWALGACVHFLATGKAPIRSVSQFERDVKAKHGGNHPKEAAGYTPIDRYYAARVPREVQPINLTQEEQRLRGIAPLRYTDKPEYYPEYSCSLNDWMMRTLNHKPHKRPSAMDLLSKMIPDAKAMVREGAGADGLVDLNIRFT